MPIHSLFESVLFWRDTDDSEGSSSSGVDEIGDHQLSCSIDFDDLIKTLFKSHTDPHVDDVFVVSYNEWGYEDVDATLSQSATGSLDRGAQTHTDSQNKIIQPEAFLEDGVSVPGLIAGLRDVETGKKRVFERMVRERCVDTVAINDTTYEVTYTRDGDVVTPSDSVAVDATTPVRGEQNTTLDDFGVC